MLHCMKIGIFGLVKNRLSWLGPGDQLVCCVTKEKPWKLVGFGEVTSEVYADDEPVFRKDGDYIFRFNFMAEHLSAKQELNIQDLMPELSFVTQPVYWPVYFKSSIKALQKADFEMIKSRAVQRSKAFDDILGV